MHPNQWWGLKGKQEGCVFVSHTFKLSDWFSLGMPCFCDFFIFLLFVCAVGHMGTLVPRPGINPYPCIGSAESQSLDGQGSPTFVVLINLQ